MAIKTVADFTETTTLGANDLLYAYISGPYSRKFKVSSLMNYMARNPGLLIGGKLSVTVASGAITVAIKTLAGNNPSATEPVFVNIGGTVRAITAATSRTAVSTVNWCNAGSAELATNEIDWFAYVGYKSATSTVGIGYSRWPNGKLVSDFSATTTNEKHLIYVPDWTSTDSVEVCGRFAATLSASASYAWSVPTFTAANLIQEPIYETRRLSWTPTHSRATTNYTNLPTSNAAYYQIIRNRMKYITQFTQHASPGGSGNMKVSLPFTEGAATREIGNGYDANTAYAFTSYLLASTAYITLISYDADSSDQAVASHIYAAQGECFI